MYDKSDSGKSLRKYVHVCLAMWHNFKWASLKIVEVFGRDFIAPLFHQIWPDKMIDIKNISLSSATTILSYLRLSYPSFKENLMQSLSNADITAPNKRLLKNLWSLMEFFIPVTHDFYLCLKLNDGEKMLDATYKLFIACCMLHKFKVTVSGGRSHHYPKIQLVHLLVMQHWEEKGSCVTQMMAHNTGIFNEELGETTFSMLSRCTLGDTIKDNFAHMSKMYSLLPLLRDVKDDVVGDIGLADSLSWRHVIDEFGEEVVTSSLFMKRIIRLSTRGTYKVYDSESSQFRHNNITLQTPHSIEVYMDKESLNNYVTDLYQKVSNDLHTYFICRHESDFPAIEHVVQYEPGDMPEFDSLSPVEDDNEDHFLSSVNLSESIGDNTLPEHDEYADNTLEEVNATVMESPYLNRSWNAWGNISRENLMIGSRDRRSPVRLLPTKRRLQQ